MIELIFQKNYYEKTKRNSKLAIAQLPTKVLKKKPRKGWLKAFKQMHNDGEDKLVFPSFFNDEKNFGWTW